MSLKKLYQYHDYIKSKYEYSEENYTRILKQTDNIYEFLNDFDMMNVYPLHPELLIIPIKSDIKMVDDAMLLNTTIKDTELFNIYVSKFKTWILKVNKKINELQETDYSSLVKPNISKYFSWELVDNIRDIVNFKISVAWLKSYEMYNYYNINELGTTVKSLHICELPGNFISSLYYYCQSKNINLEWIGQSLKWDVKNSGTKPFGDDFGYVKKYPKNWDFATGNGDITNVDNIKHYINKYKNIDLVTSDCGDDCSKDFTKQEESLTKLYIGQFLCALGTLREGGIYISKTFTFFTLPMIQILYLGQLFFDNFSINRTLTSKPTTGELYIIGIGFRKNTVNNFDMILDKLLERYENNKPLINNAFLNEEFLDNINYFQKIVIMRRIINVNKALYGYNNNNYINSHPEIYDLIKETREYFNKYFIQYYKIIKHDKHL